MRILFAMQSPGYIRNYESVLRALLQRGHALHLAFERPQKYAEILSLLEKDGSKGALASGASPKRKDRWGKLATDLRAAVDYVRYLDPHFRHADGLRRRMEKRLPPLFGPLKRIPALPTFAVRFMVSLLRSLEDAVPSDPRIEEFLQRQKADVMLITPLVTVASAQTDLVKSARAIGLPTALCVGSWDHLTTKGLIRIRPDKVIVWNETQRREAMELHGIPASDVEVTGAQLFDHWFERKPSASPEGFRQQVGLYPSKPFILFVGSTSSISPPDLEVQFIKRWIRAIRECPNDAVRELGILIRPHPYNAAHWGAVNLAEYDNVALWQHVGVQTESDAEEKSLHFEEEGKAGYFDSLYHSAAVVGVNSSALIEAAIVGRPVCTVTAPEFAMTQRGTLHFHYLLPENGGFLRVAADLEEHLEHLAEILRSGSAAPETTRFVASFVRPRGLHQPATLHVVEAIEHLSEIRCAPQQALAPWLRPVRGILGMIAERSLAAAKPKPKPAQQA